MKLANPTIVIIQDKSIDTNLIAHAFKKIGVSDRIHFLSGGREAIAYMMGEGEFADRNRFAYPTFVVTDLHMSDGDGFSILEFLKTNPEWAIIPTIVLSASKDLDDIKSSYLLGASSYHIKPDSLTGMTHLMLILHAYWMTCEVPEVDRTGRQLHTDDRGKLSERFKHRTGLTAKIHRTKRPAPASGR
jgi:CheY-like chemotaxis protein